MKHVSIRNLLDSSITIGRRTMCAVRNINENLENSKIVYKMHTRAKCKVNWQGRTFIYLHFHCMFFFVWTGFQMDEFVFKWYVKLRLCVLCKFVWAEFHNTNLHNIRTFCIVWTIQLNICCGRCYVGVSWKAEEGKNTYKMWSLWDKSWYCHMMVWL
jgi:hypothetical protein